MSSPESAAGEADNKGHAGLSESTEMEEHSYSVTGSESHTGDLESDAVSVSQHSMSQYDEDPLTYMGNRRTNAKKQTIIINKLKSELAHARNTIAMAKMNDIVILKTKLRAAESDLNRARVQNLEFKENIEKLELRLFELLSSSTQQSTKKAGPGAAMEPLAPQVPHQSAIASPGETVGGDEGLGHPNALLGRESTAHPQEKEELWLKKKATKLDDVLSSLPDRVAQDIRSHLQRSIGAAAEADRKTISELVKELHRMEQQLTSHVSGKCDRGTATDCDSIAATPDSDKHSAANKSSLDSREYTQRDLLYCFFIGALVMLLSVVVSALGPPV